MITSEPRIQDSPPDTGQVDVREWLGGLTDYSRGKVLDFFEALSEPDREIVSWYVQQGLSPNAVEGYVDNLVRGFAVADPERKYDGAQQAAQEELDRVLQYFRVFLDSNEFFPWVKKFNQLVRDDETNEPDRIVELGWCNYADGGTGVGCLRNLQKGQTVEYMQTLVELAKQFISKSDAVSQVFNQEKILREAREFGLD